MDSNIQNNTKLIKDKAKELGFISCGIFGTGSTSIRKMVKSKP